MQAVFENHWGIGIFKPFSSEIRYTLVECESMLKQLKEHSDTNAWLSQRAFTAAVSHLRGAGAY